MLADCVMGSGLQMLQRASNLIIPLLLQLIPLPTNVMLQCPERVLVVLHGMAVACTVWLQRVLY